jgi:hypothetical protein
MTETTTVTVLFTDVGGSTRLRQYQGETAAHGDAEIGFHQVMNLFR